MIRISFSKRPVTLQKLSSDQKQIDIVDNFKLLGVTISSNLTWNSHITDICTKASKRLYALRILKRSGAPPKDIITVYCSFIRPVVEYASQVWHFSLPHYLNDEVESIQRRALRIALPDLSYDEALDTLKLKTLYHRRQVHCQKLYKNILTQKNNKLRDLLPELKQNNYNFRNPRKFNTFQF